MKWVSIKSEARINNSPTTVPCTREEIGSELTEGIITTTHNCGTLKIVGTRASLVTLMATMRSWKTRKPEYTLIDKAGKIFYFPKYDIFDSAIISKCSSDGMRKTVERIAILSNDVVKVVVWDTEVYVRVPKPKPQF